MPAPVLDAIEAMLARGEGEGAIAKATSYLETQGLDPKSRAAGLWLRARAYRKCARLHEGIADLEALGRMTPDNPRVFSELGTLLSQAGETRRAAAAFSRAVQLDPKQAWVWSNFGSTLRSIGERDAALRAYEVAVKLDPKFAAGHVGRGVLLEEFGRTQEAEAALEAGLSLEPKILAALIALGIIHSDRGAVERATELFERAAAAAPSEASPWMQLGRLRADIDDLEGSRAAYGTAAARDPQLLRAHMGRCLTLPNIYPDRAAVQAERARYGEGLSELEKTLPGIAIGMPHEQRLNSLRWSNFLLGYQGEDDRALQQRYGMLVTNLLAPAEPPPARPSGRTRVRVGFVSSFFRDGTVGRYFSSWVTGLDPQHFEIVVYHLYAKVDVVGQAVRERADQFRDCPRWAPAQVEKVIRADAPDILVYPELGMDATTFALGALRLAPLQVAGWGHPVTTGLPAMDIFLSSATMETPDSDRHYSEQLVRMPGIGTHYSMPRAPEGATREQFQLPPGVPLLLCPQSHFKITPEDDALIARVMVAVPEAVLVVFKGRNPVVGRRFLQRLDDALRAEGTVGGQRIVVISPLAHDDYLRVNTVCDVMLDTTRWSGGNTALDAIACGLPIVTMPGALMRSRQTAGMYALMGIEGLTVDSVDDYVATAVRLLRDPVFRAAKAAEIVAKRSAIFDDPAPLRALNRLLLERSPAR